MDQATVDRLWGWRLAFEHPVTIYVTLALFGVLLAVPGIFWLLKCLRRVSEPLNAELWQRYYAWLFLIPALLVPILLGAGWTILGFGALSVFCYGEYARAVGIFREKLLSLLVVVGIVLITFAVFDHWYNFFNALTPLAMATLVAAGILADQPKGYIQRVGLSVLGFALFGTCMGHLGYMANDSDYRPRVILLLLAVEANDVFAFLTGKTLGRTRLCPNTSPNKTVGGALGAMLLTTLLVVLIGAWVYPGFTLAQRALLGALISFSGQLGDLALSSIKRDLGLKDMGVLLPGHGGLLDRFDSILLAAPVYFHYVGYYVGFGLVETPRILTDPPTIN